MNPIPTRSPRIVPVAFAVLMTFATLCPRLRADAYPPRPLPDEDRQTLNEYLGNNVVGEALVPPPLPHGIYNLIPFRDALSWHMLITSGKAQGTQQSGSARLLDRVNGVPAFRLDLGDDRNVLYGQLDPNGNILCYASQDNQEGVISRFSPPQPIFLADVPPGQTRDVLSNLSVADLSDPDVQTHSGSLDIQYTYLGAYRLQVPAGTFDAVLIKTTLTGKVGPANIQDTIYRFYAKTVGPVAVVETDDISALFVYHERTRTGKVLQEITSK